MVLVKKLGEIFLTLLTNIYIENFKKKKTKSTRRKQKRENILG